MEKKLLFRGRWSLEVSDGSHTFIPRQPPPRAGFSVSVSTNGMSGVSVLRAEKLGEALFNLRVPLLQLVGVHGDELEIFELRFVRWIGHFRMTGI